MPTRVALAARQVQFYLRPCGNALPELLGKRDDDALRAADVTEPVHVLVLGDFAYELSAMGTQVREDVLDVVDGEHDATYAQRVHWCVLRLSSDRRGRVELGQLKPTVAVRGPHHRNLALNVLEPNDKVDPTSLDWHLAVQFHTPTVSPLMIPLVYCHINGFQRVSNVEKPWLGGENRIDRWAAHLVEW